MAPLQMLLPSGSSSGVVRFYCAVCAFVFFKKNCAVPARGVIIMHAMLVCYPATAAWHGDRLAG
jgi:hypothetical protein